MSFSDKYLSFKTSRMNPLAESTAIGSPMGFNQSPDSFRGNQKRKPISPLSQDNKQRQTKMHIEPHILTNAQSPGIVKRLVSYYGESQGESDKNKYVYNRVGDFPLVQLKKNEIKRNLTRSPSMRIAPPNRTLMNRDIRAAILRSNSFQLGSNVPKLMPTKMRAKDDLHQIITNHDPLPTTESAQSAKSVLDALEKNCRKRINNEELTLDRNKRVCATTQQEAVDAPSTREFMPITPQSTKRSREQISPTKTGGNSPYSQQTKKFRIRNNALLSSLSSSHFVLKPQTVTSSPSLTTPPKPSTITLKETSKALSDIEKEDKKLKDAERLAEKKSSESLPNAEKRLYLFNRKVDPSSYSLRIQDDDDDDEIKINFVKPRETAPAHDNDIMRQADKEKLSMMLSGLSDGFKSPTKETPLDSVDAVTASISFKTVTTASLVSPIATSALTTSPLSLSIGTNSTSSSTTTAKAVEATEKLTLPTVVAPSVTVAPKRSESEAPKTLLNFQFGAPAAPTSSAVPVLNVASTVVSSTTSPSAKSAIASIPSGKLSPLFGSSNETSSQTPSTNIQNLITFTPIAKSVNVTSVPSLFPLNSTLSATVSVAPTSTAMNSSGAFNFGAVKESPKPTSSFAFGSNLGSTNSTSSNNLAAITPNPVATASQLPTTTVSGFNNAASAAPPAFSFGANSSTTSNNLNKGTSGIGLLASNSISFGQKPETTTASGIGFSFSNQPTVAVVIPTVTAVTTASGGFNFGSQSLLNTAQTSLPAATTNSFFGASAAPAVSSVFGQPTTTAPAAPLFGQQAAPAPSTFPGFGPKTESTTASGMFSFGQKSAATVPAASSSTFSFGGSAPAVTTSPSSFSFGQANPMQSTATAPASSGIFSRLGDKPAESKPAFSFGGAQQQSQPSNISSPFGNTNNNNISQTSPPMFGSSNATFNQTPASNNNMFGNISQSNLGPFGTSSIAASSAAKSPPAGGMFSFGGNNQPSQPQAQPSPPSSMFNFGGNAAPVQASPAANLFGNNTSQNVSASFSFKASNGVVAPTPNAFGQNQIGSSAPPPAYQFGQQVGNNVSASYTFGGSSANALHSAPSNGFNFNGPQPQTAPVGGGFNFQGQQPVLTPQPSPGGGLFNIGTGGNNQQQRRPIRQATRRMK